MLQRCGFRGNLAVDRGGGCYLTDANADFNTCLLSGNVAPNEGGGLHVKRNSSVSLANCTVAGNYAGTGGGSFSEVAPGLVPDIRLTNTVLWDNATDDGTGSPSASINLADSGVAGSISVITHCLIANETPTAFGPGNLDGTSAGNDPRFNSPLTGLPTASVAGDFHFSSGSPLLDAGWLAGLPVIGDLDGHGRLVDGDADGTPQIDIGAYERTATFDVLYSGLDPHGDENGNGVVNLVEYAAGADPTQIGIYPTLLSATKVNGSIRINAVRLAHASDLKIVMEAATSLPGTWEPLEDHATLVRTGPIGNALIEELYDLGAHSRRLFVRSRFIYQP